MAQKNKLTGNVGKTSVAELILARSKFVNQPVKPAIELVKPAPGVSLEVPETPKKTVEESVSASNRQKEMIFSEAVENRDYYITQQLKDNDRLPWFRYVRKMSQYSEFVMLNSDMAKSLLEAVWTEDDGNRKLKPWLKDGYKRDIESDSWIPSDESIGIDFNGVVYNGRHRLTAMSELDKEWPFYITFNALEEAKFTADSGAKRNASEKLRMIVNTKLGNRATGFCKALMKGIHTKVRYTETEIAEFAHKWEDVLSWVSKNVPHLRAEVQAALAKAYIWYGPEKIEPFAERINGVRFVEDGDPARTLYIALQKAKVNRINVPQVAYKKTLAAIDATMQNKPITRLYERETDIFQWKDNWELPEGSWWAKNKNT